MLAVERDDRTDFNAGRIHVDQQETDAFLALGLAVGAHQAEDHVGVLAQRGPGLLAVDDVVLALRIDAAHGTGTHRRQVGAGARFREALAPPVGAVEDARQPVALLRLIAVLDQHRSQHADAERHDARRVRQRALILEYEFFDGAPAGAAELARPVVGQPATLIQDGVPLLHVGLGQVFAVGDFVGQALGQLGGQEGAHFAAELFFFRGEIWVHDIPC